MKNQPIILLLLLALFAACSRVQDPETADYTQLKVGNYWIYDRYMVFGDTLEKKSSQDSAYVEKDTLIRGKQYFKLMSKLLLGDDYFASYLRDSAGCLVDDHGKIHFSNSNFKDTLFVSQTYDILRLTYKMDERDSIVTVPAGTFKTLVFHGRVYPLKPNKYGVRHQGIFRADGIGCVLETYIVFNALVGVENRLVRYHVK